MTANTSDIVIDTANPEQTVAVGAAVGGVCRAGDLIALEGELGAGKTQLVRGLAEGMGLNPRQVSSPTFVLMQEYEPDASSDEPVLLHIDAYRIKSDDDLHSIGWVGHGEELRDGAVIAIEWASLIERALGDDVLWISVVHESNGRRISLSARGAWRDKINSIQASLQAVGLCQNEGPEP